ncbi:hypothetical protein [Nonomuraea africana]|uniref:Uncharacterized protein n=1 Tax=Nonomuraea africana TaxID=46171 RepID=A0ABR9K775_9ACTN|nr:hypothetical protein [Nonomuraea africana]MBE1557623.1 hypothetical protein [Nonomuraea africana]
MGLRKPSSQIFVAPSDRALPPPVTPFQNRTRSFFAVRTAKPSTAVNSRATRAPPAVMVERNPPAAAGPERVTMSGRSSRRSS